MIVIVVVLGLFIILGVLGALFGIFAADDEAKDILGKDYKGKRYAYKR